MVLTGTVIVTDVLKYGLRTADTSNDLGLSQSDLSIGGNPDIAALRDNTKEVAGIYLARLDAEMCRIERWSIRTLRQKIATMLYERTALSKEPEELARIELGHYS